ncbi:MAG: tRNA glutamyl-Q(34) synthetase GluQRS [Clostridia bacterium]|nr:tRNA glutamyl-Q(34) synthetase GluQRS [Clostridia bacterium]
MITGRFAPSPSGYLHPGNLLCALLAWLSCRSRGGRFLVRIEDLDPNRCPRRLSLQALQDLRWLGLTWDEEPLWQSDRTEVYRGALDRLSGAARVYPCFCTRAELHASFAPNLGDVNPVYSGKCRCLTPEEIRERSRLRRPSLRLQVPDETIAFSDALQGGYAANLAETCGDFILRRSDGIFAYQLAVVCDDAASGVTEVVRGRDILPSTPMQIHLCRLLGFPQPAYAHIPLLTDSQGRRLSKRDGDISLSALSRRFTRDEIVGMLGFAAGLLPEVRPASPEALLPLFSWEKIPKDEVRLPFDLAG